MQIAVEYVKKLGTKYNKFWNCETKEHRRVEVQNNDKWEIYFAGTKDHNDQY